METALRRIAVFSVILHPLSKSMQQNNVLENRCVLVPKDPLIMRNFRRQFAMYAGPPRSVLYNSNPGYEPYWVGGHWVFDKLQTTTEKQPDTLCGNTCPMLFREFGTLCGRNINYTYKTYKDYCELVNEDCLDRQKWRIAYRGECQTLKTFPTQHRELVTRAMKYITELAERLRTPPKRHYG